MTKTKTKTKQWRTPAALRPCPRCGAIGGQGWTKRELPHLPDHEGFKALGLDATPCKEYPGSVQTSECDCPCHDTFRFIRFGVPMPVRDSDGSRVEP